MVKPRTMLHRTIPSLDRKRTSAAERQERREQEVLQRAELFQNKDTVEFLKKTKQSKLV